MASFHCPILMTYEQLLDQWKDKKLSVNKNLRGSESSKCIKALSGEGRLGTPRRPHSSPTKPRYPRMEIDTPDKTDTRAPGTAEAFFPPSDEVLMRCTVCRSVGPSWSTFH
jgi:hypothetical protein